MRSRRLSRRILRGALPVVVCAIVAFAAVWFGQRTATTSESSTIDNRAPQAAPLAPSDPDWSRDVTAPVVTVSTDGPTRTTNTHAAVTFEATAVDDIDGDLRATCMPTSGQLFPVGTTVVTCTATDAAANVGIARVSIQVIGDGPTRTSASVQDEVLGDSQVASTSGSGSPNVPLLAAAASLFAGGIASLFAGVRLRDHRKAERLRRDRLRERANDLLP